MPAMLTTMAGLRAEHGRPGFCRVKWNESGEDISTTGRRAKSAYMGQERRRSFATC